MIHLPASVRVYLCLSPCDMRRSFDGLHALVRIIWNWILSPAIFTCSPTDEEIGSDFVLGPGWVRHLGETSGGGQLAIPSAEPGARRFEISVKNWERC